MRRRRLHAAVQVFQQPIGRNDLVAAQQQDREESALPRAAEFQRTPIDNGLERPKDSKVHTPRNRLYPGGSRAATGEPNPLHSRSHPAIAQRGEKIMKVQAQQLAAAVVLAFATAALLASGASATNTVVTSQDAIECTSTTPKYGGGATGRPR